MSQYLRDVDGEVPEICSDERKKFLEEILRDERAIQEMSRVLSDDYQQIDYLPADFSSKKSEGFDSPIPLTSGGRPRAVSYAEGSNAIAKPSPSRDIFSGVWGGSLDLHYLQQSESTHSPSVGRSAPIKIATEKSPDPTPLTLSSTGITPIALKTANYSAEELRLHGYTASQLIGAGLASTKLTCPLHSPTHSLIFCPMHRIYS
jgi:hypothetical protein